MSQSIKLITYNTHLFESTAPPPVTYKDKERRIAIAKEMLKSDSDIFGLCEVWAKDAIDTLEKETEFKFDKWFADLEQSNVAGGLALFSKLKITSPEFIGFTALSGEDALTDKGVLGACINNDGQKQFRIFLAHAQASYPNAPYSKERLTNLKTIRDFVDRYYPDLPAIILGDLNVAGEGKEYELMMNIFSDFQDAYASLRPTQPGFTYNEEDNFLGKRFGDGSPSSRLDYVLVSRDDFSIDRIKVITNWKLDDGTDLSDHYPISCDLRIH